MFREAVLATLGVGKEEKQKPPEKLKDQAMGEYCRGKHIAECLKEFGSQGLAAICRTCPD